MTHDPHADPHADLREALETAVRGVEPAERLAEIRTATARARTRRRTRYAGAAALLAAAVVVTVAVVDTGRGSGDAPVAEATPPPTGPADPADPSGPATLPPTPVVYYVADATARNTPATVLQSYPADPSADPLALLTTQPPDPDYRTPWPAGSLESWQVTDDAIVVRVTGGPVDEELPRQQLLWTLHAFTGRPDLPVRLGWADGRAEPIRDVGAAAAEEVLSLVLLDSPREGQVLQAGDEVVVTGRTTGPARLVSCRLLRGRGADAVPFAQAPPAEGGPGPGGLVAWRVSFEPFPLEPGPYTVLCTSQGGLDRPAGTAPDYDTRSITVEP